MSDHTHKHQFPNQCLNQPRMVQPILIIPGDQEIDVTRIFGSSAVRAHYLDFDLRIYHEGFTLDDVVYLFTFCPGNTLFEVFVEY